MAGNLPAVPSITQEVPDRFRAATIVPSDDSQIETNAGNCGANRVGVLEAKMGVDRGEHLFSGEELI